MSDTATLSDEVRTREAEAPASPLRTPLSDVASRIPELITGYEQAQAKVREGLKAKSEAMAPAIEEARTALEAPRPMPSPPPIITQPPSRKLTEFLAPVEGESPETSVLKLIQAMGLFATGIGGLAKRDARAGLAAFTGALKGWHAGDKERADRAFADWQANTETALNKWKIERTTYQDIMEAANLSIEQKFKLVQLKALDEDNKMVADIAAKGDLESLFKIFGDQQKHQDTVALAMARLVEAHEGKRLQLQMQAERMEETKRHNLEMEAISKQNAELKKQAAESKEGATKSAFTLIDQIERLIPDMEKKGLLARDPGAAAVAMAGARRSRWIPGIGKPGDPTLGAWKIHAGTMVAILRQLGDIGPRAMAAYASAVELIDHPTTGDAVKLALDNLREALRVAHPHGAPADTSKGQPKADFRYNPATGLLEPVR